VERREEIQANGLNLLRRRGGERERERIIIIKIKNKKFYCG